MKATPWASAPSVAVSPKRYGAYYLRRTGVEISVHLAYRGELAIWLLWAILEPIVLISVWSAAAGPGATIGGYDREDFATYFTVQALVALLTVTWMVRQFEFRVRSGSFTHLLVRPIHPIHDDICALLGYRCVGILAFVPAIVAVGMGFGADSGAFTVGRLAAFVLAVLPAAVLCFLLDWMVACAAFWVVRTSALGLVYRAVAMFLSGSFAPLAVLPSWVQKLAYATPFPWLVSHPVEVAMGTRSGTDVVVGIVAQVGWIAVAATVLRVVWARGCGRYTAVGG